MSTFDIDIDNEIGICSILIFSLLSSSDWASRIIPHSILDIIYVKLSFTASSPFTTYDPHNYFYEL